MLMGVACADQSGELGAVHVGKMDAADAQRQRDDEKMHKSTSHESNSFESMTNGDCASESRDEVHRGVVVDFIRQEVGSELTSLKNVGELLERVRAEKETLDEQVSSWRHTHTHTCGPQHQRVCLDVEHQRTFNLLYSTL